MGNSNLKAVIMAGGQGTRLRPLTSNQPKPMIPVANRPLLEHIIELLKRYGYSEIIVTLQFLPAVITNYFGDGSTMGVTLTYVTEEIPLGTAGSVCNAKQFLDSTFIVISGDALTDIELDSAVAFHKQKGAAATIILKKVSNPLEFGIVITDIDGKIAKFLEKPDWGEVFSDTINTGIYVLEPEILKHIPKDTPFDFAKDLFPFLLSEGFPLYGYIAQGYWSDIGNHDQYLLAHKDILDGNVNIRVLGHRLENNIWMGDGVEIDESVTLNGPLILGNHVKVERGTKLREYSVLGNNVVVKRDNFIHRSILMDNSYVGPSSHIRGCVIGRNCDIKSGVRVEEGAFVGDDCLIGDNAVVNPSVLIYPFKTVESWATVDSSIIWESRGRRSIFGKYGVSGLVNVDITPEKAVKLGMAHGSFLPVNSQVVTSRDGTRAARIIKRAYIAGLNAAAVHVRDLEVSAVPVNRFTIDSHNDQGGVDFRTSDRDPQWIDITLYDEEGRDLEPNSRRQIEKIYTRNDFRRAFFNELGEIYYPARAREAYTMALLEKLDLEKIRKQKFKVVFDYGFGAASLLMPGLLGKLECEVLSLNAYTDEKRLITSRPPLDESLKKLGEVVLSLRADLGLIFDNSAQRLAVVDECGNPIKDTDLLLLMIDLVTRTTPQGKIAIPVDQPSVIEKIASLKGFEVVRTRTERASIMSAASSEDIIFAGSGDGGFIFPDFMPAYDAIMTFAKLLEMLASTCEKMSYLASSIPEYHIIKKEIVTSWDTKGSIMRNLMEMHSQFRVDPTDGIKVYFNPDQWVLVIPDHDQPVFHLWAEADTEQSCLELIEKYTDVIKKIKT